MVSLLSGQSNMKRMHDTINSRVENTATCHQEIDEFGWNYSRVKPNYKTYLKINLKINGWFNMQENDQLWWSIFDRIRKFLQVGRKDNSSFYRWCSIFRFFDLWQFVFHQNKFIDTIGYSSFDCMYLSSIVVSEVMILTIYDFEKMWTSRKICEDKISSSLEIGDTKSSIPYFG